MRTLLKVRVLLVRIAGMFRRERDEERLREEIETHLGLLVEECVAQGMSPDEARAAARRRFGGAAQTTEAWRDQRGFPLLAAAVQDFRFGLRLLGRNPGFAGVAVAVLGLGIGVNNMLFTVLNAHTLRGLPIRDAGRVLHVALADDRRAEIGLSHPEFLDLVHSAKSAAAVAALSAAPVALSDPNQAPERVEAAFTSAAAFEVVGIQPIAGRAFEPGDDRPGAPRVVVLGEQVWRTRYGGRADVLGRAVAVDRVAAEVIGVVPDRAGFPSTAAIWLPLQHAPGFDADSREARVLRVMARLADGTDLNRARTELASIAARWSQEFPGPDPVRLRVVPINERFLGRLSDPAWLAFMTVGFIVVVISRANVANLMIGRSARRSREIAIRASLGASRGRVVRQLVAEGVVLAVPAGLLGLGVAAAGLRLFRRAIPAQALPYWYDYSVDARVLAALVLVSAGTVLVFALLPAVQTSKGDVTRALKEGEGAWQGRQTGRWTTGFVVLELALAVVLLAQVAVAIRTRRPPLPSDVALRQAPVVTAVVTLPAGTYRSIEQRVDFHRRLAERLRAVSGVEAVSLANPLPLGGGPEQRIGIEPQPPGRDAVRARVVVIGEGYFATLGVPLRRGGGLTTSAPPQQAIVNERFASEAWGDADPRGRRIALPSGPAGPPRWLTVTAIAQGVRQHPAPEADAVVYVPYALLAPATATVMVRAAGRVDRLASRLKEEVRALDAYLPVYRLQTLAAAIDAAEWNGRVAARLILVLTVVAVALAVFGLYTVTAHGVTLRTREIGVRMALGAGPRQIVAMVLRRAAGQLALGFGVGLLLVLVWSRIFTTGRPEVAVLQWQPLALVATALAVAAAIACSAPACRALRLDPVSAIRHE